jgi:hypothetical protein
MVVRPFGMGIPDVNTDKRADLGIRKTQDFGDLSISAYESASAELRNTLGAFLFWGIRL